MGINIHEYLGDVNEVIGEDVLDDEEYGRLMLSVWVVGRYLGWNIALVGLDELDG